VGINAMSEVTDEMGQATQLSGQLSQLSGGRDGLINQAAIDAERQRLDQIRAYHDKVLAWAKDHNRYEPLLPDVFPYPTRDQKLDFRRAYAQRLAQLPDLLDAGTAASEQDVADAEVEIREEAKAEERFGIDERETDAFGEAAQPEEVPLRHPSGLLTDYGAKQSARARANIARAQQFRCYATMNSLEVISQINEGITPEVRDMWDAQISLWIQEDVIAALARVNDRQAAKLQEEGQSAWVGNMPIKRLISIATSAPLGYVVEGSAGELPARPQGDNAAFPPSSASSVFTGTVSNELFEVAQFTLKMVVDARKVPEIVEEVCKDNFHTLLRVAYEDMSKNPDNWAMTDKVYGSEPAVRVVMDFETVFLGDLYRPLMPDATRAELGLGEREEDET
ncbi:MAG: hypothetical protein ACYSUI_21325, partial [Planctomycetota bacterium]